MNHTLKMRVLGFAQDESLTRTGGVVAQVVGLLPVDVSSGLQVIVLHLQGLVRPYQVGIPCHYSGKKKEKNLTPKKGIITCYCVKLHLHV